MARNAANQTNLPNGNFRERGGTRRSFLLTIIIVAALIFFGSEIIPPYFANYQLQDSIETEARFAAGNNKTQQDILSDVMWKIKDLGIPAQAKDVHVTMVQDVVTISINYSVPIDLRVYQFTLQFHPHADNSTI
ncbi:MAG: hypothetical protein ACRD4M_03830 [Candidatus Acidiferrales bacterium]